LASILGTRAKNSSQRTLDVVVKTSSARHSASPCDQRTEWTCGA
jgi:hypothetical protein